jgi:hypothetical protein
MVKPFSLSRISERVVNVVTRQRSFVVSSVYKGPDRRRSGQPVNDETQREDQLPPDAIVLPPDGLLLAKVRNDPDAIREALRRRAKAIEIVRRFGLIGSLS